MNFEFNEKEILAFLNESIEESLIEGIPAEYIRLFEKFTDYDEGNFD